MDTEPGSDCPQKVVTIDIRQRAFSGINGLTIEFVDLFDKSVFRIPQSTGSRPDWTPWDDFN